MAHLDTAGTSTGSPWAAATALNQSNSTRPGRGAMPSTRHSSACAGTNAGPTAPTPPASSAVRRACTQPDRGSRLGRQNRSTSPVATSAPRFSRAAIERAAERRTGVTASGSDFCRPRPTALPASTKMISTLSGRNGSRPSAVRASEPGAASITTLSLDGR